MEAVHPAFSGAWARDYRWVQQLLSMIDLAASGPLHPAIRRNSTVHMGLARRLVPDGESLRKLAGAEQTRPTEEEQGLFDLFFRIERRPVSQREFRVGFARRAAVIGADLSCYPLAPDPLDSLLPNNIHTLIGELSLTAVATSGR